MRRAEAASTERGNRARVLPAYIEIMVAIDDLEAASAACDELESLALGHEHDVLDALAAHTRGAITLAAGDVRAAIAPLQHALAVWCELDVPYESARSRELLAQAYRELGDDDTAALELEAARDVFVALGATADATRVDLLLEVPRAFDRHGLTDRELEVLRHLAAGETLKTIASALVLSTRTVDRHVSNIFTKLGVSTRAAATAYAHQHALV